VPIAPEQIAVFRALADPVRIRILDRLAFEPAGALELSRHLPISRQGTAKHLAILHAAGLVEAERKGKEKLYRVSAARVSDAAKSLADAARHWDRQLFLLKEVAEHSESG
jgi:DNA-binding transcriptional ArsR family regulator